MRLGGKDGPLRFVRADVERWLENARREWLSGESTATAASLASLEFAAASPQMILDGLARDCGSAGEAARGKERFAAAEHAISASVFSAARLTNDASRWP